MKKFFILMTTAALLTTASADFSFSNMYKEMQEAVKSLDIDINETSSSNEINETTKELFDKIETNVTKVEDTNITDAEEASDENTTNKATN